MNTRITIALLLLALGLGAGGLSYYGARHDCADAERCTQDPMLWLRQEFRLNDAQMRSIEALHQDYSKVCEGHCSDIRLAREKLAGMSASGASVKELDAQKQEIARLDHHCRSSTEAHIRQVASLMGTEQGERYLALVLPRLARFDHEASPSLRLEKGDPHAGCCK